MAAHLNDKRFSEQSEKPASSVYSATSRTSISASDMESFDHAQPRSRARLSCIILGLNLCILVAALDQAALAAATPTITSDFGTSTGYQWIGSAYYLCEAALGPVFASLSNIWGRKPLIIAGCAGCLMGSVMCTTSQSMAMLIAGRAISGASSGALVNLVTIVLSDMFSVRRRGLLLGLSEAIWCIAGATGPSISGALTELASWRWIFVINIPITGIALLLVIIFLDVHDPKTPVKEGLKAVDWLGLATLVGFVAMLLVGLDMGGVYFPWTSLTILGLMAASGVSFAIFIYVELRIARFPIVPLHIFLDKSNAACLLVNLAHGFLFIGGEYYLPFLFQAVYEASPLKAGLMTLPLAIPTGVVGSISGLLIHRTGHYLQQIWAGVLFTAAGFGMYIAFSVQTPYAYIIGSQIVAGIGVGFLFTPVLIALQARISQADTASATASFGLTRNTGASMSIVIAGVILQNSMGRSQQQLRQAGLSANLASEFSGHNYATNIVYISKIADLAQRTAVESAYSISLRNLWSFYTGIAALAVFASLFIAKTTLSKEHVETKTGLSSIESSRSTSPTYPEAQQEKNEDDTVETSPVSSTLSAKKESMLSALAFLRLPESAVISPSKA